MDLVIRNFITNAEYLESANDLLRAGKEAEALRYVPRERAGNSDQLGAVIFGRNEAGQFVLVKDADGDEWLLSTRYQWIGMEQMPMLTGFQRRQDCLGAAS